MRPGRPENRRPGQLRALTVLAAAVLLLGTASCGEQRKPATSSQDQMLPGNADAADNEAVDDDSADTEGVAADDAYTTAQEEQFFSMLEAAGFPEEAFTSMRNDTLGLGDAVCEAKEVGVPSSQLMTSFKESFTDAQALAILVGAVGSLCPFDDRDEAEEWLGM